MDTNPDIEAACVVLEHRVKSLPECPTNDKVLGIAQLVRRVRPRAWRMTLLLLDLAVTEHSRWAESVDGPLVTDEHAKLLLVAAWSALYPSGHVKSMCDEAYAVMVRQLRDNLRLFS